MLRNLLCLFYFSIFLFGSLNVKATSITATQNGNWNSATTWGDMGPPGCFDTIVIPAGITVTVTVSVNLTGCPPVAILVSGALNFQTGKKLDLPNGSYVFLNPGGALQSGGGGGNSNIITIAGTAYWSAGCTGSPPPDCGTMTGPDILCQSCFLPIELINFEAELLHDHVAVTWQTASELDNDYFWVERSADGINWHLVEEVNGADNSSVLINYGIDDRSPLLGISYYRLKQVDNNGDFSVSAVRVISNGQFYTEQELLVLPSSANSHQNIVIYFSEKITGDVDIIVAALNGTLIYSQSQNLTDENWIVISIDHSIASGVYLVRADKKIEKVYFE